MPVKRLTLETKMIHQDRLTDMSGLYSFMKSHNYYELCQILCEINSHTLYSCGHKYRDTLTCNLYEMVLICFA